MIFVTLGTQDKSFKRLVEALDKEIEKGNIKDKVIAQVGYTKYKSKNMEIFKTVSRDKLDNYIISADLVITHGGVGSILTALKYHKKIIAAPRISKYNEHTNDHQKEIVDEFAKKGYLLALKDFNKLDKIYEKAKTFKPKEFVSNKDKFNKFISNYIEETDHISWFNQDKNIILTLIVNFLIFFILNSLNLNIYLNFFISFILSTFLMVIFKEKRLTNKITVLISLFLIEGLSLVLLVDSLYIAILPAKILINILIFVIYHFLIKKR